LDERRRGRITKGTVPENVNSGICSCGGSQNGNPQKRIFQINASRSQVDNISRQRFGKASCPNQASTGPVNHESRYSCDYQSLPGITLKGDVDNYSQWKIDIGERWPHRTQGELQDYGNGENCGDLELRHLQQGIKNNQQVNELVGMSVEAKHLSDQSTALDHSSIVA